MTRRARGRKAALYIRVSTETQAREGESIPAQRERLRRWAADNGYAVVAEYIDAGESARVSDRPEFVRMLRDARQQPRPFDAILVWKWDRFARNAEDAAIYKGLLRRQLGVEVIAVGEPTTGGAVGVLLERILDVVAEFQSLITAEHVTNTMQYLAKNGRWLGKVPFGYRMGEDGRLEVDEDEARAVRWAFEEVGLRGASMRAVAEAFATGRPFPVTLARGYKWSPQAVRVILRNPVYTGTVVWYRRATEVVPGPEGSRKVIRFRDPGEWIVARQAVPAIVPQDLFDAVQRALDQHRARPARRRNGDYLFRGLVVCSQCGARMSFVAANRKWPTDRLVCSRYFRFRPAACRPLNYVRVNDLVAIVEKEMRSLVEGSEEVSPIIVDNRIDKEKELAVKMNDLLTRRRRLVDAYEAGALDLEELKRRLEELDREKDRLEAERERLSDEEAIRKATLQSLQARVREVLPILTGDAPPPVKTAAVAQVVREIRVSRQGQHIEIIWHAEL